MPTTEAKTGEVTSSPTTRVASDVGRSPVTRASWPAHTAVAAVARMSTRPAATTGRPVTRMPPASSQTFRGEVAEFASRKGVRPQCPCSTTFRA